MFTDIDNETDVWRDKDVLKCLEFCNGKTDYPQRWCYTINSREVHDWLIARYDGRDLKVSLGIKKNIMNLISLLLIEQAAVGIVKLDNYKEQEPKKVLTQVYENV